MVDSTTLNQINFTVIILIMFSQLLRLYGVKW